MPLDYNILNNQKSVIDQSRLQQDFDLKKAATLAAIQGAGVDAATKANIYKTQVLSAATATGDQGLYDRARANLSQNGIDISDYPDDVAGAAQVAQAGKIAQSPYGALINGGAKIADLTGTIPPALKNLIGGGTAPPAPTINISPPAPINTPTTGAPAAGAAPVINTAPAQMPEPPDLPKLNDPNSPNPPAAAPAPLAARTAPQFSYPAYDPASGKTFDAYNKEKAGALDLFKLNNAASIKRDESFAGTLGETDAKNVESAKKADELTKRLEMNLQAMLKLNKDVPSSGFIPGGAKSYLSQALSENGVGNGQAATAGNQWDQINNQQVLSEIQQFLAAGGANTRINQTLDKIVQAASGINRNDTSQSREAQIKNALAEIKNKNVSVQNLVGNNQNYQEIPVNTSAPAAPAAGMNKTPSGITYRIVQ